MNDLFSDKSMQEAKEIRDIVDEYKKTEDLLNHHQWDELYKHVLDVQKKHLVEAKIYNAGKVPPMSIQENALNCMTFLRKLLADKGIHEIEKQLDKRS